MFYGRFQVAVVSVFYVVGSATGVLLIFRELLGLDPTLVFVIWLCVVLFMGRNAYVRWRQDWGPNSAYTLGESVSLDQPSGDPRTPLPENPPKVTP